VVLRLEESQRHLLWGQLGALPTGRGEDFCGLPVADDLQHEQEHRLLCFNHYNVALDPEY
jgi:hypothetical protein